MEGRYADGCIDSNNDGLISNGEGSELHPFGIYAGDLHVFDADGDGDGDLATAGFGAGTRRAADGRTLAIPETNLFLYTSLEDGTSIFRCDLDLYGLANGTISSGDIDGDGDLDLLLNGEDFFALPGSENNLSDSSQAGGNPVTLIYRNLLKENRISSNDFKALTDAHSIIVEVTDGTARSSFTVNLNATNFNESHLFEEDSAHPGLSAGGEYSFSYSESTDAHVEIGQILATDHENSALIYSILTNVQVDDGTGIGTTAAYQIDTKGAHQPDHSWGKRSNRCRF